MKSLSTLVPVTRRGLEYRAPVDSISKEPPYGSREIVYWMMLDGRRMKRHHDPFAALADKRVRRRLVYTALVYFPLWLSVSALILLAAAASVGAGFLAFAVSSLTTGLIVAIAVMVAALLASVPVYKPLSEKVLDPAMKAGGISHDEQIMGMYVGLVVLLIIYLIARVIS